MTLEIGYWHGRANVGSLVQIGDNDNGLGAIGLNLWEGIIKVLRDYCRCFKFNTKMVKGLCLVCCSVDIPPLGLSFKIYL